MDDRQHKVYFDRQILPVPSGLTSRPLVDDERGLGRGANSEGIIKGTGTSLEGGFTSIDKAAVSAC